MTNLLDVLTNEKRAYVTKEELANYLDLTLEDVERTIFKIKFSMNLDLTYGDKLNREAIYYLSTRLPWTFGDRDRNRKRLLKLYERLKYIKEDGYRIKYQEEIKINNFLERIKLEKRTYITDFDLAVLLDLDLGDVVSIIEKVAEQVTELNKHGYPRPKFIERKEDGKYLLDKDCLIFLLPDFGENNYINRCKMIELIRLLYLIQLEKNI